MEKSALTVSKKNFDGMGKEVLLLLPACAEGFLELDEAFVFVTAGRCERQFSRIERPLSIQKFKVGRSSNLSEHPKRLRTRVGLLGATNVRTTKLPRLSESGPTGRFSRGSLWLRDGCRGA